MSTFASFFISLISTVINWIETVISMLLSAIEQGSYSAIVILMTIESSLIPFPSEIVMIPAGILVQQQKMNFLLALAAGLGGSIIGACINYYLAFFLSKKLVYKVAAIFFIKADQIEKIEKFFLKHGEFATFFGRLIPGVRQLISLPAGFAKMNFAKFIFYTSLGAGIWNIILIIFGFYVSKSQSNWQSIWDQNKIIIVICCLIFGLFAGIIYFLLRKSKHRTAD